MMASGKSCATLTERILHLRLTCKKSSAAASSISELRTRTGESSPAASYAWRSVCTACRPPGQTMKCAPHNLQRARSYTRGSNAAPPQPASAKPSSRRNDEEDNNSFLFGRYDVDEFSDDDDPDFFMPNLSSTEDDDDVDSHDL